MNQIYINRLITQRISKKFLTLIFLFLLFPVFVNAFTLLIKFSEGGLSRFDMYILLFDNTAPNQDRTISTVYVLLLTLPCVLYRGKQTRAYLYTTNYTFLLKHQNRIYFAISEIITNMLTALIVSGFTVLFLFVFVSFMPVTRCFTLFEELDSMSECALIVSVFILSTIRILFLLSLQEICFILTDFDYLSILLCILSIGLPILYPQFALPYPLSSVQLVSFFKEDIPLLAIIYNFGWILVLTLAFFAKVLLIGIPNHITTKFGGKINVVNL